MPIQAGYTLALTSANDQVAAGSAAGAWIPLNFYNEPFDASFAVYASGNERYSVQHTFDDIQDASVTPVAFDNSSVSGVSTNIDGSYTEPVAAVRLAVVSAAASGATSAQFRVIQSGY